MKYSEFLETADDLSARIGFGLQILNIVHDNIGEKEVGDNNDADALYGVYDYLCILNEKLRSEIDAACASCEPKKVTE